MCNESERWIKTFVVVLLILIFAGCIIAQEQKIAKLKAEIYDAPLDKYAKFEGIITFDDDVFLNGDGVLYIQTKEGKWFIEAHRID